MSHSLQFIAAFCVALMVNGSSAVAQRGDDDPKWNEGYMAPLLQNGKPDMANAVPNEKVFAEYKFEIQYDPSNIYYRVAEFRHNSDRIFLDTWHMGQILEGLSPDEMNKRNHSKVFALAAGDEISFFREMWWKVTTVDANEYYAAHTIGYSVELLDAKTHKRLAILDSISLERQKPASAPQLYAEHPLMTTVKYSVPKSLKHSGEAYLRINLSMESGGEKMALYRVDSRSIDISARHENDGHWKKFAEDAEKYNLKLQKDLPKTTLLRMSSEFSNGEVAIITDKRVMSGSALSIIHAVSGKEVFKTQVGGAQTISASINEPGTYIVSLSNGGKVLESQKITVTR